VRAAVADRHVPEQTLIDLSRGQQRPVSEKACVVAVELATVTTCPLLDERLYLVRALFELTAVRIRSSPSTPSRSTQSSDSPIVRINRSRLRPR
jgi:hypothetical protein